MKHAYTRHKKPLNSEMNVVPYIDVMLVLLIIFMVTAPMLTTGVEVNLPQESTQNLSTTDEQLPIIITIDQNGAFFISAQDTIDEPVSEHDISVKLMQFVQNTKDGTPDSLQVMINADRQNAYETVVRLMATLQQAGIHQIGLLTDSPPKTQ